MKKETIDLIKSMTEQGFLVIIDPEKLKGDGAVMIEVINLKEGASKANDEKINDEIAKLAGFKKEDKEPEIDLLQCDGRRFRAKIREIECEGVISVESDDVFLCQNSINGHQVHDKKGFRWSWFVYDGRPKWLSFNDVTDFELLPEPRVIFTNCVGEVFTEEDVDKNSRVCRWVFKKQKIHEIDFNLIHKGFYIADAECTDIFRSKKSLLKYLYETCE